MTIENRALHAAYDNARAGRCGGDIQEIATCADSAAGAVMCEFRTAGVAFPNDDRMMNIELKIFEAALNAAGINYRNLAFEAA